jgi:hypothetical protein
MHTRFQYWFYTNARSFIFAGLRLLLLMTALFMSACESKWEKMPDDELAAKASECLNMNDPAPAMIQVCKNYKRECERRRKTGKYVC